MTGVLIQRRGISS